MVDVYLCRHAHVDYAPPAPITAGNTLTPLGREMAVRLAERCAEWDLEHLFVSSMRRAQETADAISARFPQLPRLDMPEFAETHIADLAGYEEGLPSEDMHSWQDHHHAYANKRMWARVARGWEIVQRVAAERNLERVAIVGHGGPFNALVRLFMGGEVVLLRTCWLDFDWAATACLRYTADRRAVRWLNDARHIDDLRQRLSPVS
ncbi:MAG: histidine phosphatase family protein [Anaerolineae bacterium]|nr:histidine phosphatase family protein [Anaerolineae bacterium]